MRIIGIRLSAVAATMAFITRKIFYDALLSSHDDTTSVYFIRITEMLLINGLFDYSNFKLKYYLLLIKK